MEEQQQYTPVNLPTTGPSLPPIEQDKPTSSLPTKTDQKLKRIYTTPWLLTIIGLMVVIGILGTFYLTQ